MVVGHRDSRTWRKHRSILVSTVAALLFLALFCSFLSPAFALSLREKYELALIERGLKYYKLLRESKPKGKTISKILIYRENVIGPADPWPKLLNLLHIQTRESIVRRELLVRPSEVWNKARVAETERNLRRMVILAAARLVPCQDKDPGKVVLLVVVKDLWSLRVNSNFSFSGNLLGLYEMRPTEANFLGQNKMLGLHLRLSMLDFTNLRLRDHFGIGQLYYDDRFLGTRLQLLERVLVQINGQLLCGGAIGNGGDDYWCSDKEDGSFNGIFAHVSLARPLFSLATRWAFKVQWWIDTRRSRSFKQNTSDQAPDPGEQPGLSLRMVRFQHPNGQLISMPRVFDTFETSASASASRVFGKQHVFSTGIVWYLYRYTPPPNFPFDSQSRAWFVEQGIPRSEHALYAFVTYSLRATRFIRLRNVQSFAYTEDFSVGPTFSIEARAAANLDTLAQSFGSGTVSFSYNWFLPIRRKSGGYRDGNILTFSINGGTRYQPVLPRDIPAPWVNSYASVGLREISPMLGVGRLHLRATLTWRWNPLDLGLYYIGGTNGIRGYPSSQFAGLNLFLVNVEFRTLPITLFTLHLGLVLFYDGGSPFGGVDPQNPAVSGNAPGTAETPFVYRQSVGIGIRAHFPQFDKQSIRIDFGIPLSSGAGEIGTWFQISFGQAF